MSRRLNLIFDEMKLKVIKTGSNGNAYLLSSGSDSLLLDAGASANTIIREAKGLKGLTSCLVTHEHKDHSAGADGLMGYGVDVYMTEGTATKLKIGGNRCKKVRYGSAFDAGVWRVIPFETKHDAEEPCGYLVKCVTTGETILYATDTYYLKNTFPGVNFWLVECNYIEDIAEKQCAEGIIDIMLMNRLRSSHMSLRRLLQTLSANDLTQTRKIILCHMSDYRADETKMVQEVKRLTGKEVLAAFDGMETELSLCPF